VRQAEDYCRFAQQRGIVISQNERSRYVKPSSDVSGARTKALYWCEKLETIVKMGVKIISCFGRLPTEKMSLERKKRLESAVAIIRATIVDLPNVFELQLIGLDRVHAHAQLNKLGAHKVHNYLSLSRS
jgi:hypothetical protein